MAKFMIQLTASVECKDIDEAQRLAVASSYYLEQQLPFKPKTWRIWVAPVDYGNKGEYKK